VIRQAVAGEAVAVRDLVLAAYQRHIPVIGGSPGPMLDDFATRIARDRAWMLDEAGEIEGVLVLQDLADAFLLDNIAVRPDRQRLGHGRRLLDFAEAEAGRRGWETITR